MDRREAEATALGSWTRRALVAWIAAVSGFALVVAVAGGETAGSVLAAMGFLGVAGPVSGWGWIHLFDLA